MRTFIFIALLSSLTRLHSQDAEIDRLVQSELKMTFPSVYFKHKSTEYASMPYSVDSCFKYIAINYNSNINSLVIWRDSTESESLTEKRIKKLKSELKKYVKTGPIDLHSMQGAQKISRATINNIEDKNKLNYLLSLNSVFDFSKSRIENEKYPRAQNHVQRPRISCWDCWRNGFHLQTRRKIKKMEKRMKKKNVSRNESILGVPPLVLTPVGVRTPTHPSFHSDILALGLHKLNAAVIAPLQ